MDSKANLVIDLGDAAACDASIVGGKAARLSELARSGFRVPRGFCISSKAYQRFLLETGLDEYIAIELARKPAKDMRWEEIWDSALRIRSQFLNHDLSPSLAQEIVNAWGSLSIAALAVRSSSIDEDSSTHSFAGLHESLTDVSSEAALLDAVRIVWASLWSDAALLYRSELGLTPSGSSMAVLIQEMIETDCSGVAFAEDPRGGKEHVAIIEAVGGPCSQLVDGSVDPDHWEIDRRSKKILHWQPGERSEESDPRPLLDNRELHTLLDVLEKVDARYEWAPDIEWTGSNPIYLLQARPITPSSSHSQESEDDKRAWYLTLRPGDARLKKLRQRVADELIPELRSVGKRLAEETLELYDDHTLAEVIVERELTVERWKKIYWDDFIPFAHGVRRLATYYNDAVHPTDPYEFVGLLRNQPMLASERNMALLDTASKLKDTPELKRALRSLLDEHEGDLSPAKARSLLSQTSETGEFLTAVEALHEQFFDISYEGVRLCDDVRAILHTLCELADDKVPTHTKLNPENSLELEQRLIKAVGPDREREARQKIETARVSWTLRDDDNLLLARVESQLARAAEHGAERLRTQNRLKGTFSPDKESIRRIVSALKDGKTSTIELKSAQKLSVVSPSDRVIQARQLIGQPASPGLASGIVRRITGPQDLGKFCAGEVLVCDAIQPMMTHIVPLACAIVERRGGMLIHGAIIARELGIPCVNGVKDASTTLEDGQFVSVDGNLGIVTVGGPHF